jgi:gamma-D-glutamyl-L-lysine dipeptidyl-peptidase
VEKRVAVSYASCSVPAAPIRREPSHRSEQTNELLFGERVEVLEHNPETDWAAIKCSWDGYEGWCKMGQLQSITLKEFWKEGITLSANHLGQLKMDNGGTMLLPIGSELTLLKKGKVPAGAFSGKFKGKKLSIAEPVPDTSLLLDAARSYLHSPYHWGGRSLAGIDCSGLVQVAFKLCGQRVLRDASQQATMGTEVHFLAESQPGDLAFFDNAEGRIVHVGILTAQDEIIHATDTAGRVVIDRIDGAGIISLALKRRTHNLRTIKRVW